MKSEQLEIEWLKREGTKLKAKRGHFKKKPERGPWSAPQRGR